MALQRRHRQQHSNQPAGGACHHRPGIFARWRLRLFSPCNDSTEQFSDLYRIPVLGGAAQNLIHDVDGGPAFSQADPKRLIFIRLNDPEVGKYYLLSADLEGGNEKVLVAEKVLPAKTLSWSPDAKFLADVIYTKDGSTLLRTFDLAVKKWRALAEFKDRDIPAVNWAPDGRGVYVCYRLRTAPPHVAQIGYVSFPRGEFREMTNDLNGYLGINISKDGKFIDAAGSAFFQHSAASFE